MECSSSRIRRTQDGGAQTRGQEIDVPNGEGEGEQTMDVWKIDATTCATRTMMKSVAATSREVSPEKRDPAAASAAEELMDNPTFVTKSIEKNLTDLWDKMSNGCLLYTSPSPRDQRGSRMPSSA